MKKILFCLIAIVFTTLGCGNNKNMQINDTDDLSKLIEKIKDFEQPSNLVSASNPHKPERNDIFMNPDIKLIRLTQLIVNLPYKSEFFDFFEKGFLNSPYESSDKIYFHGYGDQLLNAYGSVTNDEFIKLKERFIGSVKKKIFTYPLLIDSIQVMIDNKKGGEILQDKSFCELLIQSYKSTPQQSTGIALLWLGHFDGLIFYFNGLSQNAQNTKEILDFNILIPDAENLFKDNEYVTLISNLKKCRSREESIILIQQVVKYLDICKYKSKPHFSNGKAIYYEYK